jgi:hypothetical protein
VKWGFKRDDTETPTEGPLVIEGGIFGDDLSADKLLFLLVKDEELSGIPHSNSQLQIPTVVIDGRVVASKATSMTSAIGMALECGQQKINRSTPTEKIAGAGI